MHAPALQVVVVDDGKGVFEAVRHMRPSIQTPSEALVRALEPHVSGAFPEGEAGSGENAGMAPFFVAELAKATAGRLLLASRGATCFLDRSREHDAQPILTNCGPPACAANRGSFGLRPCVCRDHRTGQQSQGLDCRIDRAPVRQPRAPGMLRARSWLETNRSTRRPGWCTPLPPGIPRGAMRWLRA